MFKLAPKRVWLIILWLGVILIFHLAWTQHPSAAFTLSAFDLAEQIRIHPAIEAESPALRTSALLWLIIPLSAIGLALTAALYQDWRARWLIWSIAGLVALRVIPPDGVFRDPASLNDNAYHRVLSLLTLFGLLGVGICIIFAGRLSQNPAVLIRLQVILCALLLILPLIGFNSAYDLMSGLQPGMSWGGGLILHGLWLGVAASLILYQARGNTKTAST